MHSRQGEKEKGNNSIETLAQGIQLAEEDKNSVEGKPKQDAATPPL